MGALTSQLTVVIRSSDLASSPYGPLTWRYHLPCISPGLQKLLDRTQLDVKFDALEASNADKAREAAGAMANVSRSSCNSITPNMIMSTDREAADLLGEREGPDRGLEPSADKDKSAAETGVDVLRCSKETQAHRGESAWDRDADTQGPAREQGSKDGQRHHSAEEAAAPAQGGPREPWSVVAATATAGGAKRGASACAGVVDAGVVDLSCAAGSSANQVRMHAKAREGPGAHARKSARGKHARRRCSLTQGRLFAGTDSVAGIGVGAGAGWVSGSLQAARSGGCELDERDNDEVCMCQGALCTRGSCRASSPAPSMKRGASDRECLAC